MPDSPLEKEIPPAYWRAPQNMAHYNTAIFILPNRKNTEQNVSAEYPEADNFL
jgi:hypothetical protein